MTIQAFQFRLDGREAGPVRRSWDEAAQDAVDCGYAVWTGIGQIRLDSTQGASIYRGQFEDGSTSTLPS